MTQQGGRLLWGILAVLIIGAMTPCVGMAQTTTRISLDLAGGILDNASDEPLLSADGRYVAFASSASNLVAGDGNGTTDIFVYDRQAKTTTRVSLDLGGGDPDWHSSSPAISADGRFVAYSSLATDLVPGDSNEKSDIFVYDREAEITTRVSVNLQGGDPDGVSYGPALSADGRFVAFESDATNLVTGDGNGTRDIFVYDRQRETTTRVSGDRQGGCQ